VMYRVLFDTRYAVWRLQFLKFWLLWINVKYEIKGPDGSVFRDLEFNNPEELNQYIKKTGIDQIYPRQQTPLERDNYLLGQGCRG